MTETEKQHYRQLKADTADWLHLAAASFGAAYHEVLAGTDPRLEQYAREVAYNPSHHNLYELLALKRYLQFSERYEWRAKKVKNFFKFYELIRFTGATGSQRYNLTPVQAFQFASIFGFYDKEGRRLCRTAYIFVPRKFSKTTSAASLAVYDMLFGDNNAQAYVGANSYEQAKVCFDEIRHIMQDIDPTERHFQVNREKITFKDRMRDSMARCLTANAKTQDGLNASLVIMDEYAQARNTAGKNGADLKNVLTSSMGARREPLTVVITTASEVLDGPFYHELETVKKILEGDFNSDSIFASLFMPDVDDAEDSPDTWHKVQPHLGITVQSDYYEKEWQTAQLSAENMMTFRTKLLNVFCVNEQKTWFTPEKAKELITDFSVDHVQGHPACAVAFDLSVRDDFSAVSYTLYSSRSKKFYCHSDYYFPDGCLSGHPNEQLYRQWAAEGHLLLCHGNRIDVKMVANDILRRSSFLNILRIGYDQYKSQELVNILASVGNSGALTPFSQTYGSFNLPVEAFEMLAYADPPGIELNRNPINVFCLQNCVLDEDRLENKKPMKLSHYRKIDGTITMLMTIGLLYSYQR